jgi:hypothetical protein
MQEMLRDRGDCFSQIEAALRRIERAVSRLKAEAALLRVERALNEAPLVPDVAPVRPARARETAAFDNTQRPRNASVR